MSEEGIKMPVTLRRNAVGVLGIVLFVIATNGPLSVLLGAIPLAIGFGNGIGVPGAYVLIGLLYLLFSIGFAAMSTKIKNGGAFYSYITKGLGKNTGMSAAFIAVVSYVCLQFALYSLLGQFTSDFILDKLGIGLPWWVWCALLMIVVHLLASKNIEFNGKLLGMLMIAEILIILLFNIYAVQDVYTHQKPLVASFSLESIFSLGFGAAAVMVVNSFIGFETAAIYSEEAKNPTRTVPLGLLISIVAISSIYAFSSWMLINVLGPTEVIKQALTNTDTIWTTLYLNMIGPVAADILSVLVITSVFAAVLSFHNVISRYLYTLSCNQLIPHQFSKLHPKEQTPNYASLVQTIVMLILVFILGSVLAFDPIKEVMPIAAAPASLGILTVQIMTGLAVIKFFHKNKYEFHIFTTIISPLLSVVSFSVLMVIMILNLSMLTGVEHWMNYLIPGVIFITGLGAQIYAYILKKSQATYLIEGNNNV